MTPVLGEKNELKNFGGVCELNGPLLWKKVLSLYEKNLVLSTQWLADSFLCLVNDLDKLVA